MVALSTREKNVDNTLLLLLLLLFGIVMMKGGRDNTLCNIITDRFTHINSNPVPFSIDLLAFGVILPHSALIPRR